MTDKLQAKLANIVKQGVVKINEPLKNHTTLKIGGVARYFIETSAENELQNIWQLLQQEAIAYKVLGGGSNTLFTDQAYEGVVLKAGFSSFSIIRESETTIVRFPAGYVANLAAVKLLEKGLSGFESMFGLPGTIGGAIFMNSKWPKGGYQTSDNLLSVRFVNEEGKLCSQSRDELQFAYGYSTFQQQKWLILSGDFQFQKDAPEAIAKRHQEVLSYRHQTQPIGVKTAGCVFKNISSSEQKAHQLPTTSAGYLIDQCGLKGYTVGGMSVSQVHANFFINDGSGTAADYQKLLEEVRTRVRTKFGVDLIEEVDFVQ